MLAYAYDGSVRTPEPNWAGVPTDYVGKCSAVCRSMKDCDELVKWFDNRPDFCPDNPVLLLIPNVHPPIAVCGMGFATAAEMQDACREAWGVHLARQEKTGGQFDFDDLREREGMIERSKLAEAAQYAFWDRVKRHRASPVTDPFKQFRYPNPRNRVVFPLMPDNSGWKGK